MHMLEDREPLQAKIEFFQLGELYRFHPRAGQTGLAVYQPSQHRAEAIRLCQPTILRVYSKEGDLYKAVCPKGRCFFRQDAIMSGDHGRFEAIESCKLYEVWPGNNVFCLQGRCMLGSHAAYFGRSLLCMLLLGGLLMLYFFLSLAGRASFLLLPLTVRHACSLDDSAMQRNTHANKTLWGRCRWGRSSRCRFASCWLRR